MLRYIYLLHVRYSLLLYGLYGLQTWCQKEQSVKVHVSYYSFFAPWASSSLLLDGSERDTESRYHSVVSYITYLLKRPFFSVLGLVPIWTKIILLLSQISAHSLKLVWTQHYGPDALKQQSMSRWILACRCWAESRLIRLKHSCRQNTELQRIATIFT